MATLWLTIDISASGGWLGRHFFGSTTPLLPPLVLLVWWLAVGVLAFAVPQLAVLRFGFPSSAKWVIVGTQVTALAITAPLALSYIRVFGSMGAADFFWGPVALTLSVVSGALPSGGRSRGETAV